jgi:hypothetical protein
VKLLEAAHAICFSADEADGNVLREVIASMSRLFAALPLLATVFLSLPARAQVRPSASEPLQLYGYAVADAAQPEMGYGHALGGSGGFVLEHSRLLALDFRGVAMLGRVPLHTFIAEGGPRVAPKYGRLQPYAEVLGGIGHSEYVVPTGSSLPGRGFGASWTVAAGLDLRLKYGLEWRVAEYSYNHIYAGTGASPTILDTGVVYRFGRGLRLF